LTTIRQIDLKKFIGAQGPYVEALRGSTHFIRLANEIALQEKIDPKFLRTSKRLIQFGFSLKILIPEGQRCVAVCDPWISNRETVSKRGGALVCCALSWTFET
jgi:hypothetical protein